MLSVIIRPVKTDWWGASMVIIWSEVQTCMRPSWCHCRSLSLASVKSRLVLPFWYRHTWVVPYKVPLNGCVCVCVTVYSDLTTFHKFKVLTITIRSDADRRIIGELAVHIFYRRREVIIWQLTSVHTATTRVTETGKKLRAVVSLSEANNITVIYNQWMNAANTNIFHDCCRRFINSAKIFQEY